MEEIVSRSVKPNMMITIHGHEVALFFPANPTLRLRFRSSRRSSEHTWRRENNSFVSPNVSVAILAVM